MRKCHRHAVKVSAIALAVASSPLLAGGSVGTIPFDGDGSGNGFTIDNPLFDPDNVSSAPCPDGATCTNGTATGDDLLMREVDTGSERFVQTILVDAGTSQGDFTYEASVSSGGSANAIGVKTVIDDSANGYYTIQAAYRGALFGASALDNNLAVEVFQELNGDEIDGYQTFSMETTASPNEGASLLRDGRIQILQYNEDPEKVVTFGHTIVTGSYQTNAGTLSVGAESFTYAAGNALSATWIRSLVIDEENGDIDFGLLLYRGNDGPAIGSGNSGGNPNGLLDPQYSQDPTDYEIMGISQVIIENEVSFEAADDLLIDNWDDGVFGPNPY